MEDEQDRQRELRRTLQKRLEKVTPALLSQFLYERGITLVTCLLCHSNDIVIPQALALATGSPVENAYIYLRPTLLDTDVHPLSLERFEYRLICNNCGYTSHIAAFPVLKWIEAREGDSE